MLIMIDKVIDASTVDKAVDASDDKVVDSSYDSNRWLLGLIK